MKENAPEAVGRQQVSRANDPELKSRGVPVNPLARVQGLGGVKVGD